MQRAYTSLVGLAQGARRVHVHETVIVPESEDDRTSHYVHSHAAEEAFYNLEGEVTFVLPEGECSFKPNDSIFFPADMRHGEFVISGNRLRYLVIRSIEENDPPCCCDGDK